jgi:hypothetical protein
MQTSTSEKKINLPKVARLVTSDMQRLAEQETEKNRSPLLVFHQAHHHSAQPKLRTFSVRIPLTQCQIKTRNLVVK